LLFFQDIHAISVAGQLTVVVLIHQGEAEYAPRVRVETSPNAADDRG
jgi:hypothetical protein